MIRRWSTILWMMLAAIWLVLFGIFLMVAVIAIRLSH